MRDHNKAFCELAAEAFDLPAPVYEFGSYQVEGQEQYADLRGFFPGKSFVGCDMRPGPGVDRVEDVSDLKIPDNSIGSALCIETFEHVFEVRRAFDEVFRVLRPGGVFLITSPLNFRIHAYPDDYWRMTPSCLKRMLRPYDGRIIGSQGHEKFPHTVMALAIKAPAPADFIRSAESLAARYRDRLQSVEDRLPIGEKFRRAVGQLHRSRGERHQINDYYKADFEIETQGRPALAVAG